MSVSAIFEKARELHMVQFEAFVADQSAACGQGASEVKLELAEGSRCLERFYCADFVCRDGKARIVEMTPDRILDLDDVQQRHAGMTIAIRDLVWDDVALSHDAGTIGADRIEPWFLRWCDPDDVRPAADGPFSLMAHSVIVSPGEIWADLGTAPVEALTDLLAMLGDAGAKRIDISASRNS